MSKTRSVSYLKLGMFHVCYSKHSICFILLCEMSILCEGLALEYI